MFKAAIPLVHVGAIAEGLDFYRDRLGFALRSTYRADPSRADPAYAVLTRDAALIHVSSFPGDGAAGGVVTIAVADIDALLEELRGAGLDVGPGVMDQSWGGREIYVRDPAGNTLRFQAG